MDMAVIDRYLPDCRYMLGGRGAMRDEQYKIIVGRCCPEGYPGLCQRGGPQSPNASTHMNTTDTDCTEGPCVFDLQNDPKEGVRVYCM